MLNMIRVLVSVLILTTRTLQQNVPKSPCKDVFEYEPLGNEPGRWYGIIHLSTDVPLRALWLDIELDKKADLLGNWFGDVSSKDNTNYKIENTAMKIEPGSPVDIRFFVQYNVLNQTPQLQSIKFNGKEICKANNKVVIKHQTSLPAIASSIPAVPQPIRDPSERVETSTTYDAKIQCGKVVLNAAPLVVKGERTLEGQWPWQVALYQTRFTDSRFICGGTLLTHRHVLTAAHCTTEQHKRRLHDKNTLLVFLGKHNLQTSIRGVQIRFVDNLIIHPEYNPKSYDHDVSIITFIERVSYTDKVQPACLWPENLIPISNVIGKSGSVVGWGFDFSGKLTEELNLVKMKVIDGETCLRSKIEFYNQFTSNFSYCAGNNDGSSVCNGDSGGGMVFKLEDNTWYIRGIVSLAIPAMNDNICDPNYYVIFADVAKQLTWIKSNIFDY